MDQLKLIQSNHFVLQDSSKSFEHSYQSDIDDSYLGYDKLIFYQSENLFTFKCPVPSIMDYFKLNLNFSQAYDVQANQFLNILRPFQEESSLPFNLAKLFSLALNVPVAFSSPIYNQDQINTDQQSQGMLKSTNSSHAFNQHIDYKDIVSLNMQLKSKSIIGLLFMIALFIVVFRFTKKSDSMKKKLPKTLSLFWFFSTIQLYLDLNILQIDKKPYAKSLLIGISPIDHSSNYVPEVLHLVLFLICLFYFFSLIFRFHELQGREEVEEIIEQMQHQMESQRRIEQSLPITQIQNNPQTGQFTDMNGRQQEMGGLVSQSLIQINGLTWRSSLEFYHLTVILFILFLTLVKLVMLHSGILFVRLTSLSINTLDNLEMFTNSPRVLALFTVSFLAFSQFVGRTNTDKQQYFFQKIIPFFIVIIHSAAMLLKRNFIFTYDDIFCGVIFGTSLSLYYTYESPDALRNNRFANPFLHYSNMIKPLPGQVLKPGQSLDLSDEERLRLLLKNTSATQLLQELESSNAQLANKMTKEEIKRRKVFIEEELKKRREEHEEYLRQKKLLIKQKSSGQFQSEQPDSDDGEDNAHDELDEDDYESSENNQDNSLMEYIKKTVDKKYDAFQQMSESGNEFYGMTKQEANQKFQQLLLQQLNQQLNEENKKILHLKGGINQTSEQDLAQKFGLFANNTINTPQQRILQNVSERVPVQQVVTTQGGQGQQSNNSKQTAHKLPTKTPSGRPNQRKRR